MFKSPQKNLFIFALIFALLGAPVFAQKTTTATKAEKRAKTFLNPIFDTDFPDPTVIRARDGFFYAYATQTVVNGKLHHIQVARSKNLVEWEQLSDALPERPIWADKPEPKFWAPHVQEADGKYFLYYSADPNTLTGLCLAVAVSDKPTGPFKDVGKPLQCGTSFINIDPMAFDDPRTGKKYLYWGSGFQPLKVQELAADRISFAPGSQPIDLIAPHKTEDLNDYQRLVEGVWVTYRNGFYYLFYSGDNCCGDKAHYAVMVARSRSATGPFETLAQATGKANSVILEKNAEWIAPGHNSVIRDDAGDDWIVYHAISARTKLGEIGDRRRRPRRAARDADEPPGLQKRLGDSRKRNADGEKAKSAENPPIRRMENDRTLPETNIGAMRKRRVPMADGRRYLIYYTFGNEAAETRPAQNLSQDLPEADAQNVAGEEGVNV